MSKRDKHKDQVRPTLGHLIQKSKAEASTPIGGPRTTWPPVSHFIAHLPRSHVIFQTTHLSSTTPPRTLSISPKVRNTTISSAERHSVLSGISSQPVSPWSTWKGASTILSFPSRSRACLPLRSSSPSSTKRPTSEPPRTKSSHPSVVPFLPTPLPRLLRPLWLGLRPYLDARLGRCVESEVR